MEPTKLKSLDCSKPLEILDFFSMVIVNEIKTRVSSSTRCHRSSISKIK
jgi:hypothetical protein